MEKRNTVEVGRTKCKREMGADYCDCPKCLHDKPLKKAGSVTPESIDDIEGLSAQFK